jgi:hypothetical protein
VETGSHFFAEGVTFNAIHPGRRRALVTGSDHVLDSAFET